MLLTFESALRVASLGFGVELPCRPPTMDFEIYGRGGGRVPDCPGGAGEKFIWELGWKVSVIV